ncbi:MAG: hypothetical protein IT515_04590 [Burkholderiales bacterium]|nr:hypothetical protein [Burkholderiales bacterium]
MRPYPLAFLLVVAAALVTGCAPSTTLTNAWVDPDYAGPPFRKVLVLAISKESGERRTFEDEFSAKLRAAGVEAVPSYKLLPEDGPVAKEKLAETVRRAGADGAIVTRVVLVDRRTAYSPGYVTVVPSIGYWRDFYGFYGSAWAVTVPPQAYQYDVVVVETNLWRTADGTLVWSGTTQTTDPGELRREIAGYAEVIIGALRERGLIGAAAAAPAR